MIEKPGRVLQVVTGWDAVEVILKCWFLGLWQFVKIAFVYFWKGQRKYAKDSPPVELQVDSSIGTHYYIKIMGVKYHYVETGPKTGQVILVLGDAPEASLFTTTTWSRIIHHLSEDHRIITLDLRGTGGSEVGSRVDLSPPRVVEEFHVLLKALGVSENNQAIVIGHGIGGMLTWYLAHCHGRLISKFAVVDAPHPSLYWHYPPAEFCANTLHFIQWPYLPERWLALGARNWACSRACDWVGALNYVRGAAWWKIPPSRRASPPALLVARGAAAAQLVASAERCLAPTLRLIPQDSDLLPVIVDFLVVSSKESMVEEAAWRGGLMGRVLGAVAGRGRELSARLLLPPTPA